MAEISIEALKDIKQALCNFNIDVTQIISDNKTSSAEIRSEAEDEIQQVNAELDKEQNNVIRLTKESSVLSEEIDKYNGDISKLKTRQCELLSVIRENESQMASLEQRIHSLESQLADCDDESKYDQILAEINCCYKEVSVLQNANEKCNNEINQIDQNVRSLENSCSEARRKKDDIDQELENARRKLRSISDKFERLKSIYSRIQDDLDYHMQLYVRFTSDAINKTTNQENAIRKCIDQLEIYLNTNL